MFCFSMMGRAAIETGAQAYINGRTTDILRPAFVEESLQIPVLEETFCNTRFVKSGINSSWTHPPEIVLVPFQ